jgi:hypothetical protein
MVLLTPDVTVIVHAVDTEQHPGIPAGFRWAVMLGNANPRQLEYCANAGWSSSKGEAMFDGETVAAAAVNALRAFGVPAALRATRILDHDPIPAGEDRVRVLGSKD